MQRLLSAVTAAALCWAPVTAQEAEKVDLTELREKAGDAFTSQDFEAAAKSYKTILEHDKKDAQAWHRLGFSLHALGKLDEALKAHHAATEFPAVAGVATYNIACVHALRKEKDEAFKWLNKAVEAGFTNADHLAGDSDMDGLREDPRFSKLVASMTEAPKRVRAFASATPRTSVRYLLWGGDGSPGQVSIDYGQPEWKDRYAKAVASENTVGKRWRLGANFWTTLDTNVDVSIGGTKVPAGYYYLALENKGNEKISLVLLDPADVRKKTLDAFHVDRTTGGIEAPLRYKKVEDHAEKLQIALKTGDDAGKGRLVIHFGPHALKTDVELHAGEAKKAKSKKKKSKY